MASRRILLGVGSSTMRRMLSMMLKDEGYEVKTASDGIEALAQAREEPRPSSSLPTLKCPNWTAPGFVRRSRKTKSSAPSRF